MSGTQTVGHPWSHPGEQPAPKCLQPVVSHLGSGSVTSSRRQGSLEKKTSCKEHDWLKARTWALFLDEEICPWRLSLFSHPCLSYSLFSTSPSLFPCFLLDGSYCPQRTTSLSHQGLPSASCPPGPPKLYWDPPLLLVAPSTLPNGGDFLLLQASHSPCPLTYLWTWTQQQPSDTPVP